jgi:hypothetical protein
VVRKDIDGEEVYEYQAYTKFEVKRRLKPFQVNGAVWAMNTLWPDTTFEATGDALAAGNQLKRLNVPGVIIADSTGNGKTVTAMAIMLASARPCAVERRSGRSIYRPIFLAAPQNLIRQ